MLNRYIISVVIVWAVILIVVRFYGSPERFRTMAVFCAGFMIGMLAMWIAVHVYKK